MGELTAERLVQIIESGASHRRDGDGSPPRFKEGDRVLTTNDHPSGHTRLPRYAMGRSGVVIKNHGVFAFADSNACDQGEQPQYCYAVRFEGHDLWGDDAHDRDAVILDLWDSYLE